MSKMKIEDVDKNMKATHTEQEAIHYYNPKEDDTFTVEGLAFFDKQKEYFRLPLDCKQDVSEAVYWLSSHPSGGQIRFVTDSNVISVKVKNKGDYFMYHMPASGQQGVDIYYKEKGQKKYHFYKCASFNIPTESFESNLFKAEEKKEREFIINLPLYEGLEEILIGLESDALLKKVKKHKNEGKIVVYGTSITQGGCVSRPGMSYTNALSRKLDVEFINLGFSGSGLGEPELAKIITQIDGTRMVILTYEANGGVTGHLEKYMEQFIDILRDKWPNVPILVVTRLYYASSPLAISFQKERDRLFAFQKNVVENRKAKGDNNIYFIDGKKILGTKDYEECFVDGLHPNDLGFYRIANYFEPIIRKFLKK